MIEILSRVLEEAEGNSTAVDECSEYCFQYGWARSYGPKLPALLSVLGSATVIREILANAIITNRNQTIPRLLISMSISDLFFSIPYLFTTWAMPHHENLVQSVGTIGTCTAQGLFLQLGVSTSPLFNLSISLSALLMIRYEWKTQRMLILEKCLHIGIWLYGLSASLPFLALQMYNPTSTSCWIASVPHHCHVNGPCERGSGAHFWRAFFAFFPTWPCIILGIINMILIYNAVWRLETRNSRYPGQQRSSVFLADSSSAIPRRRTSILAQHHAGNRKRSRAVAIKAIFYTLSFLLTFSLDTIVLLWQVLTIKAPHELIIAAYILFPMQGFFNYVVYAWTAEMKTGFGKVLYALVFCGCKRRQTTVPKAPEEEGGEFEEEEEAVVVAAEETSDSER